jgi:UDP-glucose 4-epimerase
VHDDQVVGVDPEELNCRYHFPMTWLVTGGAGYIGAHVVRALQAVGFDVVVVDDLSTGLASRVAGSVPIEVGTLLNHRFLKRVFDGHDVIGVVHLAAKKRVDESVRRPSLYFKENVEGLRLLLDQCAAAGVGHFLFSSSAAVYGDVATMPITEEVPCCPINAYGQTKLAGEWLVAAMGAATGMRTMSLRYFNVAGTASAELADTSVANLVPIVLHAIRNDDKPRIFGDDYPTPDGTCVRDYVHVTDVADAHVAAVRELMHNDSDSVRALNIGTGTGVSVREMIDVAVKVTGVVVEPLIGARRYGDTPVAVADVAKVVDVLGWRARHDVFDVVTSAWSAISTISESVDRALPSNSMVTEPS